MSWGQNALIHGMEKVMEKQEKIRQYDEALFDDEINVKI